MWEVKLSEDSQAAWNLSEKRQLSDWNVEEAGCWLFIKGIYLEGIGRLNSQAGHYPKHRPGHSHLPLAVDTALSRDGHTSGPSPPAPVSLTSLQPRHLVRLEHGPLSLSDPNLESAVPVMFC